MPLSPRFEELIEELELENALWHLQRAIVGKHHITEELLTEGYSRVLQLAQNTGGCVAQILEETTQELGDMPSRESLLKNRDIHIRESWQRKGDGNYNNTIRDLIKNVRLSRLKKQAQKLQDGKGIQIEKIAASIHSLPDEINKAKILKILGLEQDESEILSQAAAA